jgi:Protein of unknown function (DUF2829)
MQITPSMINGDFSIALRQAKQGKLISRAGWNGKGKRMFVFLVPGSSFTLSLPPLSGIFTEGTHVQYQSHLDMITADGSIVPWLASQTDLLADDWQIFEVT